MALKADPDDYATQGKIGIEHEKEVKSGEFLLHPSDHYGIECRFKLNEDNKNQEILKSEHKLVHKSALAIVVPKHVADELIQPVRRDHDAQFDRWMPHINLLYPFFEDISFNDDANDAESSLIGDIMTRLARFRPFRCDLVNVSTFDNNGVVFLEPSKESSQRMKAIYDDLVDLFSSNRSKKSDLKWKKGGLTPHLTIAQPVDKQKVDKKWARDTLNKIKTEYNFPKQSQAAMASFTVDCVYWIRRGENTPFRIEQAFAIGSRYPSIVTNLNLAAELKSDVLLLKFMHDKGLVFSEEAHEHFENLANTVLKACANAVKSVAGVQYLHASSQMSSAKTNSQIRLEFRPTNSAYYGLFMCGSFMLGIKCSDLDIALIVDDPADGVEPFNSSSLAYELSQNDALFHFARNIDDANVPIIELCLKSQSQKVNLDGACCDGADLQVHTTFDGLLSNRLFDDHVFYNSDKFMKRLDAKLNDYAKLFPISGLFENQNLKKYIRNYKDFQIVVSFVKYWAKCRCIYGKAFGYLGGISWSILVAYYLRSYSNSDKETSQSQVDNSSTRLAKLVCNFFAFYAQFNWSSQPVSLVSVEHVCKQTGSYQQQSPMMIHQTVYPYHNTSKNVKEKARRLIKQELERANSIMEANEANNFYKIGDLVCTSLEITDLPPHRIGFRITFKDRNDLNHIFVLIKAKTQSLVTNLLRVNNSKCDFRPFTKLFDSTPTSCYFYIGIYDYVSLDESGNQLVLDHCANFIASIKSMSYCSDYDISLEYNSNN